MNWDQAKDWEFAANSQKDADCIEPNWSWDCGFKLDFDGAMLRVSSRFYQEKIDVFSGNVSLCIGEACIHKEVFSARPLDALRVDVESYIKGVNSRLSALLVSELKIFDNQPISEAPT